MQAPQRLNARETRSQGFRRADGSASKLGQVLEALHASRLERPKGRASRKAQKAEVIATRQREAAWTSTSSARRSTGCPCASTISPQMWTEMWTAATDETGDEKSATTTECSKSGKRDLNPRPSPWQASAGTSHRRLGEPPEGHQGQILMSYVAPSGPSASTQDHPDHPEPSSLLTEFVDGFEGLPSPGSRLLSVRATAEHLGVSLATVYSLVATRRLPCVRISNAIRIRPRDLAAYLSPR